MKRLLTSLALIAGLGLSPSAKAQDTVIYYNSVYMTYSMVSDLVSALQGMGASVTTSSSSNWPTSYSGKQLVIILLPNANFSSSQANALKNFVNSGGRLVISGDWESGYSGFGTYNNYVNNLLNQMGVGITVSGASYGSNCAWSSSVYSDSLTTGVTGGMYIAASSRTSGGTPLLAYSGNNVLAVGQPSGAPQSRPPYDVIVSGDVNIFTGDCSGSTSSGRNWTFWENLYDACDDNDNDGYEDSACGGDDCDDGDSAIHPGASELCDGVDNNCDGAIDDSTAVNKSTWYRDYDSDTYGYAYYTVDACNQPTGYVSDSSDCDDYDASVYPGATETPYDGVDQDCDGSDETDRDGDGYDAVQVGGTDCDDTDASVHPGVTESPDGVDEDCDGDVDNNTDYFDDDGDGFTEMGGDCDDDDANTAPSAQEICDGLDNDCDGTIDEETECYDDDGDGYTENTGDCNDGSVDVNPGVAEIADNGIDDDCDGTVDDGAFDPDGDGYIGSGGDCDEEDGSIHPGAPEVADGIDNDCDGLIDEGTENYDDDGDGYAEIDGDCDDGNPSVHPDAEELENGVDDDCDGVVDNGTDQTDDDGDGLSEEGGDCDDEDPDIRPGVEETANGLDDDCDDLVDEGVGDADGDGWTAADGDCDDGDGWANPDVSEMCDGVDNNCDGDIDEGCEDAYDGEGVDKGSCSCTTGVGPTTGLWLLLGSAGWLSLRRRRRRTQTLAGALAVTWLSCCGSDVTVSEIRKEMEITPALVDMGVVALGETATFEVSLHALSGGDVKIHAIDVMNIDGDYFSWSGQVPMTVSSDASGTIVLVYTPDEEGFHVAQVTVTANSSPSSHTLDVRGQGALPSVDLWPRVLDFGTVELAAAVDVDLTVANLGELDVSIEDAVSTDPSFFLNEALPVLVEAGTSEDLRVTYIAPDTDTVEAEMTLDLGDYLSVSPVLLRANDCTGGNPEAYDADDDGHTSCGGDCDDNDPDIHPGAEEVADWADQDCDGLIDEGTEVYDDDGDGYSENDGDCNDGDAAIAPGEEEIIGNGIDDDCDGVVDTGVEDSDGDGYTEDGGDCDLLDDTVYPGAPEIADGLDNDCDGVVDEDTDNSDDDGDGYTENQGDCDDDAAAIGPGATEIADWIDNDCDGSIDEGTDNGDDDGDGFTENGGDCDDSDASVNPGAFDTPGDGIDNDCDGLIQ